MKLFKKLNSKGFGHIELLVVAVVVAVIGGIGTYMLTKSNASTSPATVCGSGYTQAYSPTQIVHYNRYGQITSKGPAYIHILKNPTIKRYCYVLMSTGGAYGVSKPMTVASSIIRTDCREQYVQNCTTLVSGGQNSGTYKYYAYSYIGYSGYATSSQTYSIRIHAVMTYNNVKYDMFVRHPIF